MNQPSKFQTTATSGIPVYSAYRPVVQKDKYEIEFFDERLHMNDQ
uniref:Uncharacterized protein n=1 Tax=Panagrolaimus sp. PS1159 TaxID=55785 RepID=A0AC35FI00_9BILA